MTFNNTTPVNFFDVQSNGRASSSPFVDIFLPRDPTTSDITTTTAINNNAIQQKWLNTSTNTLWELKNYTTSSGVLSANWVKIGSGIFTAESLTGNSGGPVFPDGSHNINTVGDGTFITVVGNPGTNTLTIEPAGGLTTLYTENTGTATPSAGNLNVLGTNGITTTGSGNTITINGAGAAGKFVVDAHTAPGTSPVVPDGTGQITVTGGQVAAGTTANVIRTDSLAANKYTIEIQRSQAVASTTIGDNGVSHFNSGQFTVDGNGFVSAKIGGAFTLKNQVFTTSGTYTPTTGMVYCQITAVGGGGAGGGAAATDGTHVAFGGGGGSGEVAVGAFSSATIGVSQSVTIGAAGAGASGAIGGNGGNTSVGALISANGGSGGNTLSTPGINGTPGGAGGTGGTGGDYHITGDIGLIGWANGTAPMIYGGQGANGFYGGGAGGNFPTAGQGFAGANASGNGGGGGGAANNYSQSAHAGGNGTAGIVIVQEYIFT